MRESNTRQFGLFGKFKTVLTVGLIAVSAACGKADDAQAQQSQPTVVWESLLDTDVYNSGFFGLESYDVAFAPPAPSNATAKIKRADGSEVGSFGFFPEYKNSGGVFARIQPQNHSEATLVAGEYVMEIYINNTVSTRMPFSVVPHSTSDDPFNPGSSLKFSGPWEKWAYLSFPEKQNPAGVEAHFWVGASDLEAGKIRGPIKAKLTRNGKEIAHSLVQGPGMIDHVWMRRHKLALFLPHDERTAANALILPKSEIEKKGAYELVIELKETGKIIRSYKFSSSGGKLKPHPRTVMGYKPHADYIAPRVVKKTTGYDFEEVFWVEAP